MFLFFVIGAVITGLLLGDTFLEALGFAVVSWVIINVAVYAFVLIIGIASERRS